MTGNRIWMMGAALAIIGIVALGWFLGAAPQLARADAANQQRADVEAQNAVQEAALVSLREQFERLPELEAELAALRGELPDSHQIDTFIDSVAAASKRAGVAIASITAAEASAMGGADREAGGSAETSTEASTGGQVYTIQLAIQVDGTIEEVTAFSRMMQQGKRLFFAPSFTFSTGKGTLTGYLFVVTDPRASAPAGDAEADAATEGAATGGAATEDAATEDAATGGATTEDAAP